MQDLQRQRLGSGASLHVWRDRNRGVNLLLHRAGRFRLADVKWSPTPEARAAQPLRKVRDLLPPGSVEGCALFCRAANRWCLEAAAWLGLTPP